MKELLFVGRGGEDLVLASQILADALAWVGFYVQCFPEFKADLRGFRFLQALGPCPPGWRYPTG